MATRQSREAAYAELVAGLLDVRVDAATDRFDAELAAAEDEGRVDPQTAKVLRWWQRETLRALVEHARTVVPPTLLALEESAEGVDRDVEVSSQSWARAAGDDLTGRPVPRVAAGSAAAVEQAADVEPPADEAAEPTDVPPPPADLAEHRRRLLVAGLTRVPRQPQA